MNSKSLPTALTPDSESLQETNLRLVQSLARLCEELRVANEEKACLLAIVNSDLPPPSDYSDLGVWVNEMSRDFAEAPFTTDTEMSMWLHDWLCHIRATRQLGIDFDSEDIDA